MALCYVRGVISTRIGPKPRKSVCVRPIKKFSEPRWIVISTSSIAKKQRNRATPSPGSNSRFEQGQKSTAVFL